MAFDIVVAAEAALQAVAFDIVVAAEAALQAVAFDIVVAAEAALQAVAFDIVVAGDPHLEALTRRELLAWHYSSPLSPPVIRWCHRSVRGLWRQSWPTSAGASSDFSDASSVFLATARASYWRVTGRIG